MCSKIWVYIFLIPVFLFLGCVSKQDRLLESKRTTIQERLLALAYDEDIEIRCEAILRLKDLEQVETFSYSPKRLIRKAAASNVFCTEELLIKFAYHTHEDVRMIAISRIKNPKILEVLSKDKRVRGLVAENLHTPVKVLKELAKDPKVHREIIANPNTPADILAELATKQNMIFWGKEFARNHNTPPYVLTKLADRALLEWGDESLAILTLLSTNKNTELAVLSKLAEHGNSQIRLNVALCGRVTADILEKIIKDYESRVRLAIAKNVNANGPLLRELSNDKVLEIRLAVAKRDDTPPDILSNLSNDEFHSIRLAVVKNPLTPTPVIQKMARDENLQIRNMASKIFQERKWRAYKAKNSSVKTLDKLMFATSEILTPGGVTTASSVVPWVMMWHASSY